MQPSASSETPAPGLIRGSDGLLRCWWVGAHADYAAYHDTEWGFPIADDRRLFEKVCLEGFQAGLSWLTILRKRERFRKAFEGFDFRRVASFGERDLDRLMNDPGIVRHRGKIQAAIHNARRACDLVEEYGSLAAFFWRWEPAAEARPDRLDHQTLLALGKTKESTAMSKELKRRGWKFVGPTTAYAFMQAMGLVNDHLEGCCIRDRVEAARRAFVRPQ